MLNDQLSEVEQKDERIGHLSDERRSDIFAPLLRYPLSFDR